MVKRLLHSFFFSTEAVALLKSLPSPQSINACVVKSVALIYIFFLNHQLHPLKNAFVAPLDHFFYLLCTKIFY